MSSSFRAHNSHPSCSLKSYLWHHPLELLHVRLLDSAEDEENTPSVRFASRECQNGAVVSFHPEGSRTKSESGSCLELREAHWPEQ